MHSLRRNPTKTSKKNSKSNDQGRQRSFGRLQVMNDTKRIYYFLVYTLSNAAKWHFPYFSSPSPNSHSRLSKKTSTLAAHKKRKALTDVIREMESEQTQVILFNTDWLQSALTHSQIDRKRYKRIKNKTKTNPYRIHTPIGRVPSLLTYGYQNVVPTSKEILRVSHCSVTP